MKALYLHGDANAKTLVSLDGPALKVTQEQSVITRYPLRRVARVIVSGRLQIRTEALIACLQRQIPVLFIDDQGGSIGICQGSTPNPADVSRTLEAFLERQDWKAHYQNWYSSQQQRQIVAALRRVPHVTPRDFRARSVMDAFASYALTFASLKEWASLHRLHLSLTQSLVAQVAQSLNLDPAILIWRRAGLNLIADHARILQWRLRANQIDYLRQRQENADSHAINKESIAVFENQSDEMWFEARRLFDQMDFWMRGVE